MHHQIHLAFSDDEEDDDDERRRKERRRRRRRRTGQFLFDEHVMMAGTADD